MSAFKTGLDYRTIGETRRAKFGDGPLGIKADTAPKPMWYCDLSGCTRSHDPSTNENKGTCSGYCVCD